jgi:hypothetical protein
MNIPNIPNIPGSPRFRIPRLSLNFKIKSPGTKKKRISDNYTDYYFSEGFLKDIVGTEKIKLKDISKNIGIRSFGIRGIPKLIS